MIELVLQRERLRHGVNVGTVRAAALDKATLAKMASWDSDDPTMSTLEKVFRRLATNRGDEAVALLKRAVAIQNARLQELSGREAEAAELRAELDAARARLHSLEVQNYSLQVHLKAAADAQGAALTPGRTNPDVF